MGPQHARATNEKSDESIDKEHQIPQKTKRRHSKTPVSLWRLSQVSIYRLFLSIQEEAFYFSMILVPVISAGCGSPRSSSMVGAMSASRPPSRSLQS